MTPKQTTQSLSYQPSLSLSNTKLAPTLLSLLTPIPPLSLSKHDERISPFHIKKGERRRL